MINPTAASQNVASTFNSYSNSAMQALKNLGTRFVELLSKIRKIALPTLNNTKSFVTKNSRAFTFGFAGAAAATTMYCAARYFGFIDKGTEGSSTEETDSQEGRKSPSIADQNKTEDTTQSTQSEPGASNGDDSIGSKKGKKKH